MEETDRYQSQGGGLWRSMRNEDYQEDDVWAVLEEREDYNSKGLGGNPKDHFSSSSASRQVTSATRMIPKANNTAAHGSKVVKQSSAPVNIPNWSKIYDKSTNNKGSNDASDMDEWHDGSHSQEDDEESGYKFPPHEWLANRLARSQISSFSVCEGVGRTLKGRDLSRVRNAVLTKTGFLE